MAPILAQHSGLHEFHSFAFCREVLPLELVAKIPSLSLILEASLLLSLTKIRDLRYNGVTDGGRGENRLLAR